MHRHKLMSPHQFGFRRFHSTASCLHALTENWKFIATASLDLSKAFDSLNPSGVIESLRSFGLDSNALSLFNDYLSGQHQMVKLGN